jgi:hypothetical protein
MDSTTHNNNTPVEREATLHEWTGKKQNDEDARCKQNVYMDLDEMVSGVPITDHKTVCHLAKELCAVDWDEMVSGVPITDHKTVCRLAKELGAPGGQ